MHEESLGTVIRDYLTGEELEETSYEVYRQALARLFVEERGYPRDRVMSKIGIRFPVDGTEYTRMVDLAVLGPGGEILMLVVFCSGEPGSYLRESLAAARLHDPPVPLVLATDTKSAALAASASGEVLGTGLRAIPHCDDLAALAEAHPARPLTPDQAERERRILYAYSEMLSGGCCQGACRPKARG
ncbi:type I restriction enzyme HsdR N-terminal domain-containing protein [Fundidesulfovibrio terrae]|uniref:type I restriction enzyme HsdR N-terminal domain-containing protein n=1 Tax=Fundidesulfovibrio terrae TaxID=2922866 RepID=UPI001FAFCC1F|nr:type I restriction enzyme HsdR N-terminal domain-containing protein [Fundidesulfovibrio terrae]